MQIRTEAEWRQWEAHQQHADSFQVPDLMLKARVGTEGRRRFIYTEPSNESWDAEEESTYQKALSASSEHFLRFGNLDLMHLTLFGMKLNLPDWPLYEIGRPMEVIADGHRYWVDEKATRPGHPPVIRTEQRSDLRGKPILVKGEIYSGEGPSARYANYFWDSIENKRPPTTWYPSVGGTRPKKADIPLDCPSCGHTILGHRKAIVRVNWSNLGFAKEPVNRSVVPVSIVAPAEFAKAVMAGHQIDISGGQLTGGGALRRQSIERGVLQAGIQDEEDYAKSEFVYFNHVGTGMCPHHPNGCSVLAEPPRDIHDIVRFFRDCEGRDEIVAKTYAARLMQGARNAINQRRRRAA